MIEVFQSIFIAVACYSLTVTHYGDEFALVKAPWSLGAAIVANALTGAISQVNLDSVS